MNLFRRGKDNSGNNSAGSSDRIDLIGSEIGIKNSLVFFGSLRFIQSKRIKSSWNDKDRSVKNVIARYVSVDLLILDEIGAFRGISEREKDYLFEVINARYEQMKPMIAVSNLRLSGADSIEAYLEERSFDRLCEQARLVVFDWESFRRKSLC